MESWDWGAPGETTLVAVNGRKFNPDILRDAPQSQGRETEQTWNFW